MTIALCRLDDRLIHGQVVIGWGVPLGIGLIALVDDAIGASPWEQDIYRMAVPPGVAVEFQTLASARDRVPAWAGDPRPVCILTGDVPTLSGLVAGSGGLIRQVNLGGLHAGPGRRERLPYLFLSDEELAALRALAARGVEVTARDVPSAGPVRPEDLS